MTQRLTPEVEREARELSAIALEHTVYAEHVRALLDEIDCLRAERDGLRNGLKREIAGAFVGGEVVYVSGLKLLLEDP